MFSRRLLGSAFANAFLVASLVVPSAALAGKQDEELAPGFSQCVKQAGSSEHALNSCLNEAGSYWHTRLRELNRETGSSCSQNLQLLLRTYIVSWLQYKDAGIDLVYAGGGDRQDTRALAFSVEETKRQARMLENFMFDGNKEELAPGYELCQKKAESASCAAELREISDGCLKSAKDYWEGVISQQYDRYMRFWQDSPEKQQSMQNFQKAWTAYRDAGYRFVSGKGGSMAGTSAETFRVRETRRHAQNITSLGLH